MENQLAKILYFMPLLALPILVVVAIGEGVVLFYWKKQPYNFRAALASFADILGREFVVHRYLHLSIALPVIALAWTHRLTTLPLDTAGALVVLFLGQEFCYYCYHRASHRIRWLWASHAVHHSSNEVNLSAAYRLGWTGGIAGSGLFYVPLVWLGYPPTAVFAMLSMNLVYQFWLHATWIPKLGWFEYVFNTPSHHRVHHAVNVEYLDANYGGVLIIFDRLFGTFVAEREDLLCRYGLVAPLTSNNPFVINFHEWAALARDAWNASDWRERVRYLFGPPGWRPHGRGWTTEDQRRAALAAE